ncbi:MAG: ribose-phosphate diphosphokinase [Deltaproteobacteria bacterium]|nr:ribose-phosphate diphosphokinase [Deltaproteobacteria bacterium]NIS77465.1 ribose-phosphate diphosphokinase [Deltaproteobacteria bacterium]
MNNLKVFSGNANRDLAKRICDYLGIGLGEAAVKRFSDGELNVDIGENVRGMDVFLIQPTCPPVNENLMEILVMTDALKRASANRINAVIPYYGYARQDRKVAPRTSITAKLVADLLSAAGISRLLTMDLHAGQIQGFFNIPVDHLYASPVILAYLREAYQNEIVVVSPDAGGVERARAFAKRLDATLAIIDKRRVGPNVAELTKIIGDVRGKIAVILDDMIDTAGTVCQAVDALLNDGARMVCACATHPVLSGPAIERITASALQEVLVTDTIPLKRDAAQCGKIKVLSVADLLGEAIKRIHFNESVSYLFV